MSCSLMGGILFSIIRNLPNGKVAEDVAKVVADALLPYKRGGGVKTITTDKFDTSLIQV